MKQTAQEILDEVAREEKTQKKKRQPYRKSSRMGKRGIAFLIPAIFIALTILFVFILIKMPEICLFGNCFRLFPLRWSRAIQFWLIFTLFFLVQAVIVFVYSKVVGNGIRYSGNVINYLKNLSVNVERWFIRVAH